VESRIFSAPGVLGVVIEAVAVVLLVQEIDEMDAP